MRTFLKQKYALSDSGVDDTIKAITSHTFVRMTALFPTMLAFIFLKQYSAVIFGYQQDINLTIYHYIALSIIAFIIMYLIGKWDYNNTYTKVYVESAKTRINLAEKLRKLPLAYFAKKDIADLSATIMSDATASEHLFSHAVPQLYATSIMALLLAVMLFIFDFRLALSLFWVVPLSLFAYRLARNASKRALKKNFDIDREVIDQMQEGINLVQEIKAYNRENDFIAKINQKYDEHHKHKVAMEVTLGSIINVSFVLLKLGMATVALYGAYLLVSGDVDVFTYFVFIIISASIFTPFTTILMNLAELLFLDSIVERIREIEQMPAQGGKTDFKPNGYDIVFQDVDFSYEDGVSVLNDVSFAAKQGEVTALVGPSGGGKTTATKLAARFWDIDSGKITLGGIDISEIDPETLLKHFSIVFQDVSLFNASVMENIRLGRKDATDEEIKQVAQIARCEEFIAKLNDGYDTLIGENGERLSGGERQRISIARALLKDAPIILLDEATASLDAENESEIQAALAELIKDKTVIIIAHRMRTVVDADNIVVIKDGQVAESGKSQDLIAAGGVFAKMYQTQLENK